MGLGLTSRVLHGANAAAPGSDIVVGEAILFEHGRYGAALADHLERRFAFDDVFETGNASRRRHGEQEPVFLRQPGDGSQPARALGARVIAPALIAMLVDDRL